MDKIKKRAIRSEVRRKQNSSKRSMVRTFIKRVLKAIKLKKYKLSMEEFYKAQSVIDRIADKNIISKRKSARIKSRLNLKIKREFKG
ncbi:30S ribosomal protein S20 [Candidatus Portiera aleyrodidarum]|uniref:Small ribosomal subunit protein bS20 n=1 Tax=Candidatus Portiera aleyrodidarum TV TaxID=1297582 RepID=A0A8D3X8P0_9GAMM|nr:30S ribosomal protein S20 [Candidatus Portiera aleyrodidarum]AGI27098.1 ribosomal protein S20 [Candidatus Portiera aleyrodidarum TV]CEI59065.1 30S ribosomal protein S20 [Candidatus Portiera aleyrodidarum]